MFAETSVETNEFSFIADATIMRVDNSYSCGSAACHSWTDFSRSLSRDKNVNARHIQLPSVEEALTNKIKQIKIRGFF